MPSLLSRGEAQLRATPRCKAKVLASLGCQLVLKKEEEHVKHIIHLLIILLLFTAFSSQTITKPPSHCPNDCLCRDHLSTFGHPLHKSLITSKCTSCKCFFRLEAQGKTGHNSGLHVQDGLPTVSASFMIVLHSQVPLPACIYHSLVFTRVPLPFFSDFNLADYDYLPVSSEIKELFEYIKR